MATVIPEPGDQAPILTQTVTKQSTGQNAVTGSPVPVATLRDMAVLAVELAAIIYLVVAAISYGNATAQSYLPVALALIGVHQAPGPLTGIVATKST